MAEISQCADDAVITPARIIFRHADGQVGNLTADARPTWIRSRFRTIELLGYEPVIPGKNRVGLCYARYVVQRFAAESLADFSECGPLRIGEPQARRKMRSQYAVFGSQVLIAQQQLLVNEPCYIRQQACPTIVLHAPVI